jgi:hypothetical protein
MDERPVDVAIFPRPDLGHDEAIRLGEIIQTYLGETGNAECFWSAIARSGLADLLAGELPKPLGLAMASEYRTLRSMMGKESMSVSLQTVPSWLQKKYAPFSPHSRAVFLELAAAGEGQSLDESIRPLMDVLPRNLLDSVLVFALPRSKWVPRNER